VNLENHVITDHLKQTTYRFPFHPESIVNNHLVQMQRCMTAREPHSRDHRWEKDSNAFRGTQAELKARMITRIKKCTLDNTRN